MTGRAGTSFMKVAKTGKVLFVVSLFLTSCVSSPTRVFSVKADRELLASRNIVSCVKDKLRSKLIVSYPSLSIGEVADLSGRYAKDGVSKEITQGLRDMFYSSFAKIGYFRLLERRDVTPFNFEVWLEKNVVKNPELKVKRGFVIDSLHKSDYYVTGSITEINLNSSGGGEVYINGMGGGKRYLEIEVAGDFRLVNTQTLEIVQAVSLRKKIIGIEVKGGVFNFLNGILIDINVGKKEQEPINLAVRELLDTAAVVFTEHVYGFGGTTSCYNAEVEGFYIKKTHRYKSLVVIK